MNGKIITLDKMCDTVLYCVNVIFIQLELDAAKVYHMTNVATEAIADHCPNLTV